MNKKKTEGKTFTKNPNESVKDAFETLDNVHNLGYKILVSPHPENEDVYRLILERMNGVMVLLGEGSDTNVHLVASKIARILDVETHRIDPVEISPSDINAETRNDG